MLNILLQGNLTVAGDSALTDAVSEIAKTTEKVPVWDLVVAGGWIMIVLGVLAVIAIFIFIERWIEIKKATTYDENFMNNIRDFIHSGKIDSAKALCRSTDIPIAKMIEKGVERIGKPMNDISSAIENVGKLEVAKMEKNVATLATVSSIAPMIGFLGTVMGMVTAFFDMAHAGNNIDISVLSSGIYQAMITTVGGLMVGIIGYFCHSVISARIDKAIYLLEANSFEFMNLLNEPAS